jgi:hypothetical protein
MLDNIVHSDGCNQSKPHKHNGRKSEADFACAISLEKEKEDQDNHA